MVAWEDLLGTPWVLHGTDERGLDCSTVSEEILRRLGHEPPPSSPYRLEGSRGEAGEMASYLAYMGDFFERLGDDVRLATRAGDIVVVREGDCPTARGMFVLVDPDRGTFLTALDGPGVIATRRWALTRHKIVGVYRARQEELER